MKSPEETFQSHTLQARGIVGTPGLVRARISAPFATSIETISACPPAAAHINAVWPLPDSARLTSAPASINIPVASTAPVCEQFINGVSPDTNAAFGSAPACNNLLVMEPLRLVQARYNGVTPYSFAVSAFAPARSNRAARSASSCNAAQCNAVAPSDIVALTSVDFLSSND